MNFPGYQPVKSCSSCFSTSLQHHCPIIREVKLVEDTEAAPIEPTSERVDLPINGMSCASCARRVEKQLSSLKGVQHAGVNFATCRATVEYDPSELGVPELIAEIKRTGYEAAGTA